VNSVLSEILKTGETKTSSGGTVKIRDEIPPSVGEFIQRVVRDLDPTITLEVGLAFGISALYICDALNIRNGTQHITIDAYQQYWEAGTGIANLRRAGYGDIVRLIEEQSYRALSELERSGLHVDFAFIDGWHLFDFGLVDFFFIDRMLNVGGVVAFDDANWPAIRKVCRFVKTNLAYSVVGTDGSDSLKRRLFQHLWRPIPYPILRLFHRILRPEVFELDERLGLRGRCIAFRKDADDSRPGNYWVDF
jgi:predicted O-methyltransferase YrrM